MLALTATLLLAVPTTTLKGAARPLTPETSLKVRWPDNARISPDGGQVVLTIKDASYDDNSWSTQVYLLSVATGDLRQLTFSGKSNTEPVWSPDGSRIAFTGTRDDQPQVYLLDLRNGGEAKKLTELATGASGPIWSPDGRTIAFVSSVFPECKDEACNKRKLDEKQKKKVKAFAYDDLLYRHWNAWDEGTRSHLFVIPADGSGSAKDLTPGKHHVPTDSLNMGRGYDFLDKDTLVYTANLDPNPERSTNNDLFTVSIGGGASKLVTGDNKALDANPTVSPDGRYLAYVAHARPGFESDRAVLHVIDRQSGKVAARTSTFDRGVDEIAWMPDSSALYISAHERGRRPLFSLGRDSGEPKPIVSDKSVSSVSVSKGGAIAFIASSLTAPPEVFVHDKDTRQISHLQSAMMDGVRLGKTGEIEADNHGTKVHGFVVYPPDFNAHSRYPLLIMIHGGPQGASGDDWHPRWNAQLFAAKGYVVAMPNFRGSTGYGQAFTDAISKDWGGGAYEDVMAFTDLMTKQPYIDARWMCAAGASYGGYMINWIAGHTDRFKCLISHAGVFNLESMWGDTEELWFPEWEIGGTPWQGREMYRRWSPHEYIQNAKTPTLVIHGQLDYRVHVSQGQQMFQSIRRLGVPARFVYFPDEGHFVTKPQNFAYWYSEMLGWLGKYLR
jgi:dipeptidyl aminopeptidase/acylaminoacyl peptidase